MPSSSRISNRNANALPTSGPGPISSCSMTCVPSSCGRMEANSSRSRELVDARLELVHPLGQRRCLALVSCRAITTRQHVELRQQRAGVPHVAAHRAVGPTHLIGVEPEVQRDQFRDGLDVVVGVAERGQTFARHPRAHRIVVVERHALALLVPARLWLADIVKQRRQSGAPKVEPGRACRAARSPPPPTCGSARPCADGSDPVRGASPAVLEGTRRRDRSRSRTTVRHWDASQ